VEAFTAIASLARWEARRARRRARGPWRAGWPALAADRTSYGQEPMTAVAGSASDTGRVLAERESLELLRSAGVSVTAAVAVPDAEAAVEAARPLGGHAVALMLDAEGMAH
jgi:hypothetical protein